MQINQIHVRCSCIYTTAYYETAYVKNTRHIHPIFTEENYFELYLQAQFVPRSKHNPPRL